MQKARPFIFLTTTMLMLLSVGCSTSMSYQKGVADLYNVAAARLDKYAPAQDAVDAASVLRLATIAPITYERGSAAWADARPSYIAHITADAALPVPLAHEYLETADVIDRLNQHEAKHRLLLFQQ